MSQHSPARALSPAAFSRSLVCAVRGIVVVIATQPSAWIHLAATVVVLAMSVAVGLSIAEWCWIVVAIAGVWTAEAFNTAIELVTDLASPGLHPLAGRAKDVGAGAVLIAALGSSSIGLLVLGPPIWSALVR
jgi:diacylglycerol kinase (ATP)